MNTDHAHPLTFVWYQLHFPAHSKYVLSKNWTVINGYYLLSNTILGFLDQQYLLLQLDLWALCT